MFYSKQHCAVMCVTKITNMLKRTCFGLDLCLCETVRMRSSDRIGGLIQTTGKFREVSK